MEQNKLKSILESLLFVSGEPIGAQRLAKICEITKNEAEQALAELEKDFQGDRGLRVLTKDGLYQLASSPENCQYVSRLVSGELNAELSRSSIETLAIVAYKGPATRAQIETVRGVNSSYVLRSLLMRGLIERKETADIRGYVYEISFDFLKQLGIKKVSELPDWETLSRDKKISEAISLSDKEEQI